MRAAGATKERHGGNRGQKLRSDRYEIGRRNIQRDLNKLSNVFPLTCDKHKPAGWSWNKDADNFDMPVLDPVAAMTLHLAKAHLERLRPPGACESLARQLKKAEAVLDNLPHGGRRTWPRRVRVIPVGQPSRQPNVRPDAERDASMRRSLQCRGRTIARRAATVLRLGILKKREKCSR